VQLREAVRSLRSDGRWSVAGLLTWAPKDLALSTEIHVDFRIVVFAVALSLLTGLLFGTAPALVASRLDLLSAFRGDSRSGLGAGRRVRSWLVGAEVAISVVLLAGAMLLFRSLVGLETVNPGLNPSNLLTFRVPSPQPAIEKLVCGPSSLSARSKRLSICPECDRSVRPVVSLHRRLRRHGCQH
jgi:hypothetical protein